MKNKLLTNIYEALVALIEHHTSNPDESLIFLEELIDHIDEEYKDMVRQGVMTVLIDEAYNWYDCLNSSDEATESEIHEAYQAWETLLERF